MTASPAISVRQALLTDVPYIKDLARIDSESLGFLPGRVYEDIINGVTPRHRLWLAEVNNTPVGFLYLSPGTEGRAARIIQVCLQRDARRREYGTALVERAEEHAISLQRPAVACHVATDIEAGEFWDAMDYRVAELIEGGKRRKRILESRYKRLPSGLWVDAA
jgi:ribosomal protein S18 acetylase RimI-like enzyme